MAPQVSIQELILELDGDRYAAELRPEPKAEPEQKQTRLQQLQQKYSLLDRCAIAARRRPTYEAMAVIRVCSVCGYAFCWIGPFELRTYRIPGTKVA